MYTVLGAFLLGENMANEQQFKIFTKFIATRGVEEYRQTIPVILKPEDRVLEIGCEWGTASTLIYQKTKNLIATDISLDCIKVARAKYPKIQFETLDAFNIKAAMRLGERFDVIFIDMSGLSSYRALLDVIALLNMYSSIFEPRVIIVKSGSLKQFARNCVAWNIINPKF